ncbi:MAG TPA: hypothetical protein VGB46_01475 [Flavisolibacter sp.]
MKRSVALIAAFLLVHDVLSQNIAVPMSYTFQEPPSGGQTHNIPFQITGNAAGIGYMISLSSTSSSTGGAVAGRDYILGPPPSNPVTTSGIISLTIFNNSTVNSLLRTVDIHIRATPSSQVGNPLDTIIKVNIQDYGALPLAQQVNMPDTVHVSLSLLTAASFDFFGQSSFGKYAGNINASMVNIFKRWGLNAGISHLHYYTSDTSSGKVYTSNILLDPTARRVSTNTQYRAATYALNSKTDYSTWAYYMQVLVYTGKEVRPAKDAISRFYVTLHTEAFTQQSKTTYMVDSISNTVRTYDPLYDRRKTFSLSVDYRPKEVVAKRTDGYFGIGGTQFLSYPNKFNFVAQAVFGVTTANPKFLAEPIETDQSDSPEIIRGYAIKQKDHMAGFYLVRTQIVEKYTKLNASFGVDIRGAFPMYNPLIAAYLGFQLKFDDFFKK